MCAHSQFSATTLQGTTYHQEVIEQEDLSLVQSKFLGLIWVWNLEEPAVADQPSVRQREHLCREEKLWLSRLPFLWGLGPTYVLGTQPLGLVFKRLILQTV